MTNPLSDFGAAWQRFWFAPQPTSTLALFRIGFGVLATAWTATLAPNLFSLYGPDGVLPEPPDGASGSWSVLDWWPSSTTVLILFVVTLVAAICVTFGLFSRVAAAVLLIGIISFEQRNLPATNSGDGLVRNLALFCALSPCGAALSVDRWLRFRDRFWEFPARAPWALRLVQIQVSVGYLTAVWDKAGDAKWRDGTAVAYALRIEDIHRLPTPAFITHSVVLTELLTYGTLVLELSLAVLVWNRALRPWVLLLGITLHLGIDASIMVGFFSYAMLCAYIAFVPHETATRLVLRGRDWSRRRRALVDTPPTPEAETKLSLPKLRATVSQPPK